MHDDNSFYTTLESLKTEELNPSLSAKPSKKTEFSTNTNSDDQRYKSQNYLPFDNNKNENTSKLEENNIFFPKNKQKETKSQNILPPLFKSTFGLEEPKKTFSYNFFNFEPKLKLIEEMLGKFNVYRKSHN